MRQSSIEAHKSIKPSKAIHYSFIKKALLSIGKPSTGKEIAKNTPEINYHAIMRRVSEMRELGIIKEFGRSNEKYRPILWGLK